MDRFSTERDVVPLLGDWAARPGPLYRSLAGALTRAVHDGALAPGDRLPAERRLARTLGVSRATVVAAYEELRGGGLLVSRQGSGTRIAPDLRVRPPAADGRVPGGTATTIFQRLIDGPGELISMAVAAGGAVPQLADVLRELVRDDLDDLLADHGYHPGGLPALRVAIAAHLTGTGLPTAPEEVLVTTGAHQGLVLVTQLYLAPGATVVVESPNWPGCLDVFRSAGARLVTVPLDDEGPSVAALGAVLRERAPALLYLMPTYHNPTGLLMSATRRRRIAELAAVHGVPVLEDNASMTYHSESGDAPPPLAAYAPPGAEMLSLGSLAKAVWGGLRIGWVRGPAEIVQRLARRKVLADIASPVLDQALAARLLPRLEEILAVRSGELRRRLDHIDGLLRERLPSWRWRRPDGGGALWVELPGVNAVAFAQVAARYGVDVVPGAAMDPDGGHHSHLRLPYTFPPETLDELVHRLARAWAEFERHGPVPAVRVIV
ncbi:GntR family transcriptional regulator [Sphaerisporangium melleum]|uniref:GntR family transcriptional regulator n=1 Tax=Sphaerisporangium melleum TaxID=321316 RepID=A0A917VFE7_9ACTN|nr:PLP-dependent aminotransferase family protein [Sphaerisporangium melleum]GGK70344.1 GntR family transcriptional regulator [Sphaerisporangium melleum]GII70299.1 GntR family transcriptional regulator [Sphaerisporangium melleum]